MKKISSVLYSIGLGLSALIGFLHFFAPYAFAWYSYIPDAPGGVIASVDYINFFFSLLLSGLSLLLLAFKRRIFEGSVEVLAFYLFLTFTWLCRVLITLVIPWPTALQTWLVLGFAAEFVLVLIPAAYLLKQQLAGRSAGKQRAS